MTGRLPFEHQSVSLLSKRSEMLIEWTLPRCLVSERSFHARPAEIKVSPVKQIERPLYKARLKQLVARYCRLHVPAWRLLHVRDPATNRIYPNVFRRAEIHAPERFCDKALLIIPFRFKQRINFVRAQQDG